MLVSLRSSCRFIQSVLFSNGTENSSRLRCSDYGLATLGWLMLAIVLTGSATVCHAHEPVKEAATGQAGSPAATEDYAAAAAKHNAREYKEAAVLWGEFIEQNEDDSLVSQAQHYLGVCLLQTPR